MTGTGDRVFPTLSRHFFRGFFRMPFLDDEGDDSFVRGMLGVVVGNVILTFAVAARFFFIKYRAVSSSPTPDLYQLMLPADQLMVILLPMLLVILVMAMVSDSLFPDAQDFRILMPLPVSRRTIFASKTAALCVFASFFIVVTNVTIGAPFVLLSGGRWAGQGPPVRLLAHMAAGIGASCFAAVSVVAVQGLVAMAVPQHRLQRTLVAMKTLLVCQVTLLLPGVLRLPRLAESLQRHPEWLVAAAPGWFLGVERIIRGGRAPQDVRLAVMAIAATALVFATVVACYVVLYRRFDRVSLQTQHQAAASRWQPARRFLVWHPAFVAVCAFAGATLRRSSPHQMVVFAALTSGLALTVNAVLLNGAAWDSLARAAIGAPLLAIMVTTLGLRGALLMPIEIRAAWIFRVTERADCRVAQLNAVRLILMWRGVTMPTLAIAPLQLAVIGWSRTLASLPVTLAIGWLLVELIIRDWRRIPFTCTILFGKRPVGQTFGLLCGLYLVFVVIGTRVAQLAASNAQAWLATLGVLFVAAAMARWHRARSWGRWPLEFEDSLPDSVDTLRL